MNKTIICFNCKSEVAEIDSYKTLTGDDVCDRCLERGREVMQALHEAYVDACQEVSEDC